MEKYDKKIMQYLKPFNCVKTNEFKDYIQTIYLKSK